LQLPSSWLYVAGNYLSIENLSIALLACTDPLAISQWTWDSCSTKANLDVTHSQCAVLQLKRWGKRVLLTHFFHSGCSKLVIKTNRLLWYDWAPTTSLKPCHEAIVSTRDLPTAPPHNIRPYMSSLKLDTSLTSLALSKHTFMNLAVSEKKSMNLFEPCPTISHHSAASLDSKY
jgi:hypothetical protein